jgi:hypothetical protein
MKSLASDSRFPIVALVASEEDRRTLEAASREAPFDLYFAESTGEARMIVRDLSAPIVFVDRDWPGP